MGNYTKESENKYQSIRSTYTYSYNPSSTNDGPTTYSTETRYENRGYSKQLAERPPSGLACAFGASPDAANNSAKEMKKYQEAYLKACKEDRVDIAFR